jgi:hypothetical protein
MPEPNLEPDPEFEKNLAQDLTSAPYKKDLSELLTFL